MNTSTMTATTSADSSNTLGEFHAYDSQLPIAEITGTRVVTCCYKQTAAMKKAGKDARSNMYVRIPTAHITEDTIKEQLNDCLPFIVEYFRSVETDTIRKYHKDGGQKVYTETLTLSKVLATLEEQGTGGHIDSEQITAWFTDSVAPALIDHLAAKLGMDTETLQGDDGAMSKVSEVVNGYLTAFISLASGKTQMLAEQRDRLAKCMSLTGSTDTAMGERFTKRFEKMAAKEAEALEALGDLDI